MVARDTPENQPDPQSMVSPNQQSEDSAEEEVSRESPASSMMTPELSSDPSLSRSSEMPSHTPSTPEERLSLLWMLYMLLRDKAELFMVSEVEIDTLQRVLYSNIQNLLITFLSTQHHKYKKHTSCQNFINKFYSIFFVFRYIFHHHNPFYCCRSWASDLGSAQNYLPLYRDAEDTRSALRRRTERIG